jgi:phosphatidylglycerol:prolipoprotein diacylglycerol transferase
MHPTLFTIGNLSIPTYTVLLDLGLILGLVLTYFEGKRQLGSGEMALDLGLWTVIGGILGGRIGYVLANWSTFAEDWIQALQIWKGGLAFHGAFLGGMLVLVLFALLQRRKQDPLSFWELSDLLTLGMGLGLVFGWAACLMGGCSYGYPGEGFGYAVLPDISGVEASRFATQIFGLIFALVLLVFFWLLRGRWPFSGASFLMFGLLYFTGQFFLEATRGDGAIYVGPWRLAQVLDLALALLAAAGLLILWWRSQGEEEVLAEAGDQVEEGPEGEEPEEAYEVEGASGLEDEQPGEPATSEAGVVEESEEPVEEEPLDEG